MAVPPREYLAFDLGASSGRAMLGTLASGRVTLREIHRFPTPMVERGGHLHWDLAALWSHVSRGLAMALEVAPALRGVSVDSWAVDYVPLDERGEPLRDPYAYRDPRTRGRMAQAFAKVPAEELYRRTGIQMREFNTLYQLLADVEDEPELVARTATRLTIADYLLFRLSGRAAIERTMASTTQLMDVRSGEWALDLIARLELPTGGWAEIVPPGTVLGPLLLEHGPGTAPATVVAACSHDTAAAVAGVPGDESGPPWAYLSTGTWSLLGVERAAPVLHEAARAANYTNEAGLDGSIRFLKNLMGLWMLQECERIWRSGGEAIDWPALLAEADTVDPATGLLDVNDARFGERCDMPARIAEQCAERGIAPPASRAGTVRLVLESMAADHGRAVRELEALLGHPVEVLNVVGGASRNALLCQLIADAARVRVLAGPTEATALGNILVQARTLGDLPSGLSIRDVVRASGELRVFEPRTGPSRPPTDPISTSTSRIA